MLQLWTKTSEPDTCQNSIVGHGGKNISIFSIEIRIEPVIAKSRLIKNSITVFSPQVNQCSCLSLCHIISCQPSMRNADKISALSASSTLFRVRIVAVEGVRRWHDNVSDVQSLTGVRVEHGRSYAANTAWPRWGYHNSGWSDVDFTVQSCMKSDRGLV